MTPVITDPERFDVALPDPNPKAAAQGHALRLYRDYRTVWLEALVQQDVSMALDLDQLRWLRDRFNEILGEVP